MAEQKEIKLAEHQNIYDQSPFTEAINTAHSEFPDFQIPGIRTQLSYIIFKMTSLVKTAGYLEDFVEPLPKYQKRLVMAHGGYGHSDGQSDVLAQYGYPKRQNSTVESCATLLFKQLETYPYWILYLHKNLNSDYKFDGEPSTKKKKPEIAETYLSWFLNKAKTDSKLRYTGLAALLPVLQAELSKPGGGIRVALAWKEKIAVNLY